jgi:hypothetical protein
MFIWTTLPKKGHKLDVEKFLARDTIPFFPNGYGLSQTLPEPYFLKYNVHVIPRFP